jgi:[ribosomal protein S18]-alanine N-acetyltransferase
VTLRDARPGDLDALLALENACYPPSQAYSREEYRYALVRARAVNLVREENGAAIGFIGAFHHRQHRAGHIYTVNVHPSARGRGLGKLLMASCEERLAALGMTRCILEVNVENEDAIRLYERCGYTRVERLKDYYTQYRVNDAWLYLKRLGAGTRTGGMDAARPPPSS